MTNKKVAEIRFSMKELGEFMDHCQDFYPTEGFNRARFMTMMMEALGLHMAETVLHGERYGADVTLEDAEQNIHSMINIVKKYIVMLKEFPACTQRRINIAGKKE